MLHPFALNRDVMSDFLRRFYQLIRVVMIESLVMVSRVRVFAIDLTVCALVSRAFVIQLQQQRPLYAFLIRFDDAVLELEFLDLIDGLHVLHALSIVCKRLFRHKEQITQIIQHE